jgi:peptidoglycan/LPS O-acetylase OafA/YrhL
MLQRVQSIFLLLSSLSIGSSFLPSMHFGRFQNAAPTVEVAKDGVLNVFDNPILLGVAIGMGIIALITIFLFKNRPLQMNIIKGFLVMGLVGLGVIGFVIKNVVDIFGNNDTPNGVFTMNILGFIPPFISLIFSVLAYRAIKKDEDLVRSSDRLR